MAGRIDALWRIWALLWASLLGYVLSFVVGIVALIVGSVSIVLQLIFGRQVIGSTSLGLGYFKRSVMWTADQTIYGLTGKGSFQWLP